MTTPALPWAWKLFPSTFSSKPPFSLYVICNDLKRTPGDIRAALPNFVAEEEADENVRNGTTPRRFTVTQLAAREGQLTEAEKQFTLFYSKLSNEINCGVKRALMRFIETTPDKVGERPLAKRRRLVASFVARTVQQIRKDVKWATRGAFDEETTAASLTTFLVQWLYRTLWQPTVAQLEGVDEGDRTRLDGSYRATCAAPRSSARSTTASSRPRGLRGAPRRRQTRAEEVLATSCPASTRRARRGRHRAGRPTTAVARGRHPIRGRGERTGVTQLPPYISTTLSESSPSHFPTTRRPIFSTIPSPWMTSLNPSRFHRVCDRLPSVVSTSGVFCCVFLARVIEMGRPNFIDCYLIRLFVRIVDSPTSTAALVFLAFSLIYSFLFS